MKELETTSVALFDGNFKQRQTVKQRIERRLEVLRAWLREGIPAGKAIPKNLTAVRLWEDADLRISPIVSPNEFTTTHHLHGPLVYDTAGLLTSLKRRYDRPGSSSQARATDIPAKFDRRAHERELASAISQWQALREKQLSEKSRADGAEARSYLLLEENAQKDELIADLRRQLTESGGLKLAK